MISATATLINSNNKFFLRAILLSGEYDTTTWAVAASAAVGCIQVEAMD